MRSNWVCEWPQTTVEHVEPVEEEGDPLLGRALGEDVEVVARRGVAVENVADDLRLGQLVRNSISSSLSCARACSRKSAGARPSRRGWSSRSALPRSHDDAVAEPAKPRERLGRLVAARADVAADEDRRVLRYLGEHRLERGEVAVDVVERGDRHEPR